MLGTPRGLLLFSLFYTFSKKGRFMSFFLPIWTFGDRLFHFPNFSSPTIDPFANSWPELPPFKHCGTSKGKTWRGKWKRDAFPEKVTPVWEKSDPVWEKVTRFPEKLEKLEKVRKVGRKSGKSDRFPKKATRFGKKWRAFRKGETVDPKSQKVTPKSEKVTPWDDL